MRHTLSSSSVSLGMCDTEVRGRSCRCPSGFHATTKMEMSLCVTFSRVSMAYARRQEFGLIIASSADESRARAQPAPRAGSDAAGSLGGGFGGLPLNASTIALSMREAVSKVLSSSGQPAHLTSYSVFLPFWRF